MAPSPLHQVIVELFERRPSIARDLLRDALHGEVPVHDDIRIESADLRDLTPAEVHADLVVLLVREGPVLAIIVEVQLGRDPEKRYSWPVYLTGVRRRFRCDACVLVVTPDANVAKWARKPIELGPLGSIEPLVVGPEAIPVVERERAMEQPELAVLSSLAHGNDPVVGARVARIALEATQTLEKPSSVVYFGLVYDLLDEAIRAKVRDMLPHGYEPQNEFSRTHLALGRAQGKADDVILLLESHHVPLSNEQRDRILSCTDLAILDTWVVRAATAKSAEEIFAPSP